MSILKVVWLEKSIVISVSNGTNHCSDIIDSSEISDSSVRSWSVDSSDTTNDSRYRSESSDNSDTSGSSNIGDSSDSIVCSGINDTS